MIEVAEMRCHVGVYFSMRGVGCLGHCMFIIHLAIPQDAFSL